MKQMNRRRLFKLAGAGSVLVAGVALPLVERAESKDSEVFAFRATLGLPEAPLPNYATYVIEGTLNLVAGTGLVTSRVLAGHPDAQSEIGLPGLGRIVRVVGLERQGAQISVHGLIEDRSQLQQGESPRVELVIDRERGIVNAPFLGRGVAMNLV